MLEYVAKFTELARFVDDYVATDMSKVRKFEDGLKFSIQGKFVGLLQDMDLMVKNTIVIEREVDDAWIIRDAGVDHYPIHGPARPAFKWKENVKRKCGLIFEFWKIRPQGGTVLLWSRHLLFVFIL